jgi:GNAT superfamily N-acetyltransferase
MDGKPRHEDVTCVIAAAADRAVVSQWMRDFYAEGHLSYGPATEAALGELLGNPGLGMAVIIRRGGRDGEGVGYFVLTFMHSLERGGRMALLDELFLVPEVRGKGIGKIAMMEAVRLAREAGCLAVGLEVDEDNMRARRLYESAGFTGAGRYFLTLAVVTEST